MTTNIQFETFFPCEEPRCERGAHHDDYGHWHTVWEGDSPAYPIQWGHKALLPWGQAAETCALCDDHLPTTLIVPAPGEFDSHSISGQQKVCGHHVKEAVAAMRRNGDRTFAFRDISEVAA